jgi:hypothetical protein
MILSTFGTRRISLGAIFLSMTKAGTLVTLYHSNVVITSAGLPPDENSPSRQHFPTCVLVSITRLRVFPDFNVVINLMSGTVISSLTSLKLFSVTIPSII